MGTLTTTAITDERLTITLSGRIESSNAPAVEAEVLEALKTEHASVTFDAEKLTYISSAGLRVLLKAAKFEKAENHPLAVMLNVSRDVQDILETTGFDTLFEVKKACRTIDVSGCKVIGKGFFGTVYRIDDDTIVKVYATNEAIPMIQNEQKMAKKAFLAGIPTAISYDIVKVGDYYGSVFELLKAKTLNDIIIEHPEQLDEAIARYVALLKTVHGTEIDDPELPTCKSRYLMYLENIRTYLPEAQYDKLCSMINGLDNNHHVVHGDIQMKNVMVCNDELMLIDMETLATGEPEFDLQGIYVTYHLFSEEEPDNPKEFLGISLETSEKIWNDVFNQYYADKTEEERTKIFDIIALLARIRFLFLVVTSALKEGELGKRRIEHTQKHITELLEHVSSFSL